MSLVFSLALISVLVLPLSSQAQCMISGTGGGTGTSMGMPTNFVVKTLSSSYLCTLTMSMNVIGCNPAGTAVSAYLTATAFPSVGPASCGWTCACGQITIDGPSDGLPVELLDFSVEGEDITIATDESTPTRVHLPEN